MMSYLILLIFAFMISCGRAEEQIDSTPGPTKNSESDRNQNSGSFNGGSPLGQQQNVPNIQNNSPNHNPMDGRNSTAVNANNPVPPQSLPASQSRETAQQGGGSSSSSISPTIRNAGQTSRTGENNLFNGLPTLGNMFGGSLSTGGGKSSGASSPGLGETRVNDIESATDRIWNGSGGKPGKAEQQQKQRDVLFNGN